MRTRPSWPRRVAFSALAAVAMAISMVALPQAAFAAGSTEVFINASPNPSIEGQTVTIAIRVVGSPFLGPAGFVAFTDELTVLDVKPIFPDGPGQDDSHVELKVSGLSVGSHIITATYSGNPILGDLPSSSFYTQVVNPRPKAATTTQLTSAPNPSDNGQAVVFTATVTAPSSGPVPTGPVQLFDGANALGVPQSVDGTGKVMFTIPSLSPGTHSITASYGGDSDNLASVSASVSQVVRKSTQAITFTSSPPSQPTAGGSYSVTATGGASGNPVVFSRDAASTPGACSVSATGAVSFTGVGTCIIDANQAGNANFDAAPQVQQSLTIVKATPTIATMASAGNLLGAPVRDTATLAGGFGPTGSVTFRLFSGATCATQVFSSTNNLTGLSTMSAWFTPAAADTYRWMATYNGDANNNSVVSPCNAPNESVVIAPFEPPPFTRTITGDLLGPVTVGAGESVQIIDARVVGPVTVNPGGALTVTNSKISRGVVVDNPKFLSICGTDVSGPSPAQALGVSNAGVPIRIGDPANTCAGNRFAGQVNLTANLATAFKANTVSNNTTVNNGGPGNTVIGANTFFQALACSGNNPIPTNGGQANMGGTRAGDCSAV